MKLNKKLKKEEITNPFRVVSGLKRKRTICRITEIANQDFPEFKWRVDCDEEPLFIQELNSILPKTAWYRDGVLDLYYVTEEYKQEVTDLSLNYFSTVVVDNGDGTLTTLKSAVNDGAIEKQ